MRTRRYENDHVAFVQLAHLVFVLRISDCYSLFEVKMSGAGVETVDGQKMSKKY